MTLSKVLQRFVDQSKIDDSYWVDHAKLDFSTALEKQRRIAGINYAGIAKKIGSSPAFISKVFRGDSNLTIESIVKLVRATGGRLEIQVVNELPATCRWDQIAGASSSKNQARATANGATIIQLFPDVSQTGDNSQLQEAA